MISEKSNIVPSEFIIVGGTGNLSKNKILPALFWRFSDKQIDISPKISDYIIKNIDRSYEKVFGFIKDIDELSLSSGKSININLIKKVLINE